VDLEILKISLMKIKPAFPRGGRALKWSMIIGILCLAMINWGCGISFGTVQPTRLPDQLPGTDIIFDSEIGLGFVNADGTDPTYINFVANKTSSFGGPPLLIKATTAENNQLLIGVEGPSLFTARVGEFAVVCDEWRNEFNHLSLNQNSFIVDQVEGLAVYNLQDCGTSNPPVKVYTGIHGVLSPDRQYVAEVIWTVDQPEAFYPIKTPTLTVHSLDANVDKLVLTGAFPAWSRDGQWLAYTGADGIYVVGLAGDGKPQRAVEHHALFTKVNMPLYDANQLELIPPAVSWSPDGKWLVYHLHRADAPEHHRIYQSDYDIYKANVDTGEEVRIVEHGINPYWRWPPQQP
jgi:hypothetical protein